MGGAAAGPDTMYTDAAIAVAALMRFGVRPAVGVPGVAFTIRYSSSGDVVEIQGDAQVWGLKARSMLQLVPGARVEVPSFLHTPVPVLKGKSEVLACGVAAGTPGVDSS